MGRGPDRTSAHIIFCCSLHRCKYSIHIVNNMPRTVHRAHAAGNTFLRVDDSVIFRHMNSSRWTFLLTDSAGDAGVRTDVFRGFSGIRVAAQRPDIVFHRENLYQLLRAGLGAEAAANAQLRFNLGDTVLADVNGIHPADRDTVAAAQTVLIILFFGVMANLHFITECSQISGKMLPAAADSIFLL